MNAPTLLRAAALPASSSEMSPRCETWFSADGVEWIAATAWPEAAVSDGDACLAARADVRRMTVSMVIELLGFFWWALTDWEGRGERSATAGRRNRNEPPESLSKRLLVALRRVLF